MNTQTQRLLFKARDGDSSLPNLPATLGKNFSPKADFVGLLWKTARLKDPSWGPSVGALSRFTENGNFRFVMGDLGIPVHVVPMPGFLRQWLKR